jgi:DNA polymerase
VEAAWTLAKYKVAEDAAKQEVDSFRANNPKITALWRHLDTEFRNSMGQDFTIELPSGRTMTYEKVGREVRRFKHRETGKTETKLVYTANVGGIRRQFYGGMLTENITQATARDVFGEHLVQLDKTDGVKVLFNAHDEAVLEVDEGVGVADVSRVMSRCPEWLTGCPVACEAKEVSRYEK